MKQILFVLILLFVFTVQIEVKNKTLEIMKFRNINKYDPNKIYRISPLERCGPGRIYQCNLNNSCTCILRENLKHLTLNVSNGTTKIFKPKTFHTFSPFYLNKCKPGFVFHCSTHRIIKSIHGSINRCFCKKVESKCKEGFVYRCRQLPASIIGKMKIPTICECEKDNDFMKNVKRNTTFITGKNKDLF